MSESKPKRAVIIGGSMSGLLSGLMLRRSGWDVDIYERVESELSGRGAGIVAQPELMQRLRGRLDAGIGMFARVTPSSAPASTSWPAAITPNTASATARPDGCAIPRLGSDRGGRSHWRSTRSWLESPWSSAGHH